MTYAIRYYTASHMGADGDFETLDEAREAYADKHEWYDQRGGCIVEGTIEFANDIKHAESIE